MADQKRSADSVSARHPSICGAKSHDREIDEDDPPVTCTEAPGHTGDHGGGTRCGTITWPNDPRRARLDADGTAKPKTEIVAVMPPPENDFGTVHLGQATHYIARPTAPRSSDAGVVCCKGCNGAGTKDVDRGDGWTDLAPCDECKGLGKIPLEGAPEVRLGYAWNKESWPNESRTNDAPCGSRDPDTGRPCERASKHEGEHGFNEGDPERCSACRTFVERNAPPKPRVVVKNELWDAAILKVRQLESEIRASGASDREKSNMLHTHSKLWMFATDAWEQEVTRPAQRRAADSDYPRCDPTYITKKAKVSDAEHGSQGVRRVSGGDGVAVAVGEAHGRAASDVGTSGPGVAGGELPGSESVGVNDCRPSEVPSKDALCYHCGEPAVHKVDGHVYCDHCFRCHRDPRPNEAPCDAVLHYLGARYVCTKTAGHFENGTTLDDEAHGWTERPDPRVDKAEVEDWADGVDAAAGVVRAERAHAPTWAHATLDKLITTLEKLAENYPGRDARSDYPPAVVQLALAAHAVVKGRVPALSAEREGSDWKHSRISDSLTDKLATALEALGPCTANPTSKETP